MEGGVEGPALHGELAVFGDIVLPGQGGHPLEEGLKVRRGEGPQLQQHPGAAAQVDVQPGDVRQGAVAVDPAVFRPDIPKPQPPHLIRHQGLQPEQAGNRQCHSTVSLKS